MNHLHLNSDKYRFVIYNKTLGWLDSIQILMIGSSLERVCDEKQDGNEMEKVKSGAA